jgi:hypothetical protein
MNTLSVSWIVEPAINIPLFDDTLSRAIDLAVAANAAEAKEYANAQDRDGAHHRAAAGHGGLQIDRSLDGLISLKHQ